MIPKQEQWEYRRFSSLTFMNEFLEKCGAAKPMDLYPIGLPAADPWSRLITYDASPQKYQNIPNIPHLRHFASYMWDMVEFGFDMMGRNVDILAAEGFRLDVAVSMLLDHANASRGYVAVERIKEAAELYVHLITDLNLRVGNRMISGEAVEETMQDWLVEFEKAYPMAMGEEA